MIAAEVLTLMRGGYASGAHARWRALHELAVMAEFIAGGGDQLAERYLLFEQVESLKAAREYQRYAADLNHEPISEEELDDMQATVNELCGRFGPLFKKDYGWAASVFGYAPNFRQIEDRTDLSHYRPSYRLASHPTHAGPKGLLFNIGLKDESEPAMLAGTSILGMADPGHGLCISLSQITSSFLLSRDADAGSVAVLGVILSLADLCGEAFLRVHNALESQAEPLAPPLRLVVGLGREHDV